MGHVTTKSSVPGSDWAQAAHFAQNVCKSAKKNLDVVFNLLLTAVLSTHSVINATAHDSRFHGNTHRLLLPEAS